SSVAGLSALVGVVVDGGATTGAAQRADSLAAEAARAGGQAIAVPAALTGDRPTVDARAAVAAAATYLPPHHVAGPVTVLDAAPSFSWWTAARRRDPRRDAARPAVDSSVDGPTGIRVRGLGFLRPGHTCSFRWASRRRRGSKAESGQGRRVVAERIDRARADD